MTRFSSFSDAVQPLWKRDRDAVSSPSSTSSSSSSPRRNSTSSSPSIARDNNKKNSNSTIFRLWRRNGEQQLSRLTRQPKLRHLTDTEVCELPSSNGNRKNAISASTPVSRTASNLDLGAGVGPSRSSSSPVLLPQPLPLPQGVPLPSSREFNGIGNGHSNRTGEHLNGGGMSIVEPIGERLSSATVIGSRLVHPTGLRSPEHVEAPSGGSKSSQKYRNSVEVNFRLNLPAKSAPTSGLSSPVCSPRRSNVEYSSSTYMYDNPQGYHAWSAQEIASADMMTTLSPLALPDKILASPERSPHYSPRIGSPLPRSRNPSAPPSPLHPKMFPESSATWHENNVGVHPLPLPPCPPLQSGFVHQTKSEAPSMSDQWQKGKLIGSGTFGSVYLATNRHTGALCAMKEVNLIPDDPRSAECLKQLEQEIKVLSQLKHQNIVQYYGSEMVEDRFYIYLEYVYPGSIQKYVREHFGAMTESIVRNFTRHILQGLAYLHSKKTMHRDIKGPNLLVSADGVVKLADFGMAKHLSGAKDAMSMKGTPYWMAPEVLQATMNKEVGYDLSVDIWSLGCTIIEMFTGKHPWSGLPGVQAMFKVLHYDPDIPEALSPEGKDFLRQCFRRNPAERPTAAMLLDHPFIKNPQHYSLHGSIQAFAGIKIGDNVHSPRERHFSKSDSCLKGKQLPNGETCHSPSEISEATRIRLAPRSTFEGVPSMLSSPNLHLLPSGPNSSIFHGPHALHLPNGAYHLHPLPKPRG